MIINKMPIGFNNRVLPGFTYTGNYQVIDDGDDGWRIKFLTSGTLKLDRRSKIDVFCVGGGSSGGTEAFYSENPSGWAGIVFGCFGGGGGYTTTLKGVNAYPNTNYQITVGAGGAVYPSYNSTNMAEFSYNRGNPSYAFGCVANGGGSPYVVDGGNRGGNYASEGPSESYPPENGGSDGYYYGSQYGPTTREFGDPSGALYAGGGGGSAGSNYPNSYGNGGDVGGGHGASVSSAATNGTENTGGGGGGGLVRYGSSSQILKRPGGAGGSGIVIIRNHRA